MAKAAKRVLGERTCQGRCDVRNQKSKSGAEPPHSKRGLVACQLSPTSGWEGEAPAEPLAPGSAGASPSHLETRKPKPDRALAALHGYGGVHAVFAEAHVDAKVGELLEEAIQRRSLGNARVQPRPPQRTVASIHDFTGAIVVGVCGVVGADRNEAEEVQRRRPSIRFGGLGIDQTRAVKGVPRGVVRQGPLVRLPF